MPQRRGNPANDPFLLPDSIPNIIYRDTSGLTIRSPAINPALKTLVLLVGAAQSLWINIAPTLYTPTSPTVIDQFNMYDGALYSVGGPMLGTTYAPVLTPGSGPGNTALRIAQLLITNAVFDRVIIVPMATAWGIISGIRMAQWGTGVYSTRGPVAMRRLISRGVTPATAGVTFGCLIGIGETDNIEATSQASFTASLNSYFANLNAAGFSGRYFVCQESFVGGSVSLAVRAAQAAAVDGVTIFSGGDMDTIPIGERFDGTHINDTGAASAATLVYNAMRASGAPF